MNRLLSASEVARALGISRMQFYRLRPALIAAGLRPVQIAAGGRTRYTSRSLEALVDEAELRERPILRNRNRNLLPLIVIGQGTSTVVIEEGQI